MTGSKMGHFSGEMQTLFKHTKPCVTLPQHMFYNENPTEALKRATPASRLSTAFPYHYICGFGKHSMKYLRNNLISNLTPSDTDDRLWHHATRNNPNPDKYVPVQVAGGGGLQVLSLEVLLFLIAHFYDFFFFTSNSRIYVCI